MILLEGGDLLVLGEVGRETNSLLAWLPGRRLFGVIEEGVLYCTLLYSTLLYYTHPISVSISIRPSRSQSRSQSTNSSPASNAHPCSQSEWRPEKHTIPYKNRTTQTNLVFCSSPLQSRPAHRPTLTAPSSSPSDFPPQRPSQKSNPTYLPTYLPPRSSNAHAHTHTCAYMHMHAHTFTARIYVRHDGY